MPEPLDPTRLAAPGAAGNPDPRADGDAGHPFDPVSGVLGAGAVAAGVAVAAGADLYARDLGWAVAAGAVLLGLALVPWRRR